LNGWLVDTNVLSELRKPRCNPGVRRWVAAQPIATLFVSCVSLAELRFGIEKLDLGNGFRAELDAWLTQEIRPWMAGRVLDIDETIVLRWRWLVDAARAKRFTPTQPDLFIAATALQHNLGIVTRNVADFEAAGVAVMNPWLAPA
jgi:predicted nucleic acid-binding protein